MPDGSSNTVLSDDREGWQDIKGWYDDNPDSEEKPTLQYEVSMGIYMLNRDVLKFVPEGTPYGFDELMIDLMDADQRPAVRAFDGYWLDIGRPDDYMRAIDEFDGMQSKFLGDN